MNPRPSIRELLDALKQDDATVRERATGKLWQIWFSQKGVQGLDRLQQAQAKLDRGDLRAAEAKLTEIVSALPDFAEAWNRRAVLYYSLRDYDRAIADCQKTIELNPVHFGALHGLGLCYIARQDYRRAIQALRRALEIQPHSLLNQKLILECTARLDS